MFGLFNEKEEKNLKNEHPEFLNLVKKWDIFLDKINTRFEESIVYAEEAVLENLIESDFNILPTNRAWQAIKTQLMGLSYKIDKTFDEKVKPEMYAFKEDWELLDEDKKGTLLRESIFERIERYEIIIEGKIAQKFYNHAIKLVNEDFNCTQCSAKIEIQKNIFRSHYVSCNHCNTVNTFTPNTKISEIRMFAVDNIAKYKALGSWDNYKKLQNEFNQIRPPAKDEDKNFYTEILKKVEEAKQIYWTKYFTERSILLPEYAEKIEHDVAVKMNRQ